MSRPRSVSVSRVIPVTPSAVFEVLSSPAGHAAIDGSGSVVGPRAGEPERLELGTRFAMSMKQRVPYRVTNIVVEYEKDRRLAWRHFGGHVWRYELEPVAGGTRVTETFDWSTARSPRFIELMRYPRKHLADMERTLERLEELLVGPAAA